MFNKALALGILLAVSVFAYDEPVSRVTLIYPCSDGDSFEMELMNKSTNSIITLSGGSYSQNVRFAVRRSKVGSARYDEYFAMAMMAYVNGSNFWVSTEGNTNTGRGNCAPSGGNYTGLDVVSMSFPY